MKNGSTLRIKTVAVLFSATGALLAPQVSAQALDESTRRVIEESLKSLPPEVRAEVEKELRSTGNIFQSSNVPKLVEATPSQPAQQAAPAPQTTPSFSQQPAQQSQQPAAQAQSGVTQPLPNPALGEFQSVLNHLGNATPEEIRAFKEYQFKIQGATVTPVRSGLVGRASQYTVDLSPGASAPVVRVSRGMGATINFVDSMGNPWPIKFANNFHAEASQVTQMAPHVLSVASLSDHLAGSVGVMLEGLHTPVNFVVTPAQEQTDYRVDLRIPGLSPDAPPVVGAVVAQPGMATGQLMDFLYGATPQGATRLDISQSGGGIGNVTRAWQDTKGRLILRTDAQVISPGWYERLPAMDGTSVYALPGAPVVRIAINGKEQTLKIKGLTPRLGQRAVQPH